MDKLLKFIDNSPTAFHAVENIKNELSEQDCLELSEGESWKLSSARRCFVTRNGSSLIAFCLPKGKLKGFNIFAAHTDSPSFRLKEKPEMVFEANLTRLNAEKYGGMIVSSWLDRPLSVAGRVVVDDNGKLDERLVNIDRDLCIIPNMCPHLSEVNAGYKYSVQNDMLPLFSGGDCKGKFMEMLADSIGVLPESILGSDLFLYPRQKGSLIGLNNEFAVSARFDDLACAYAGLNGFIEAGSAGEYASVLALFDNEEVGSGTKQGADSTFLEDVLFRICEELSYSKTDYLKLLSRSFMMSADNAHAVNPAAGGKMDPTNRPFLNKGVVLKYNGNQRYATDAYSAAYFKKLCMEASIPYQTYANQSDIPGGSTLGNISTAHVSVRTVDIGLPQLAMHSACETMGTSDYNDMIKLARVFFEK